MSIHWFPPQWDNSPVRIRRLTLRYIHKVSLLVYNVKWVILCILSSVVSCLFPQNWLMRPEDIWVLRAEMLLFKSLMVGYQFIEQEYFALCTSHLTIFFYPEGHSCWEMIQLFPQPNVFLRTKQAQQICGLPDKVAGSVDKAANHRHNLPNGLAAFWLLAGADFPSCQWTVRSKTCVFKAIIVAFNSDILKTAFD